VASLTVATDSAPTRDRLMEALVRRQLPRGHGWGHCGMQTTTEATALAMLALRGLGLTCHEAQRSLSTLVSLGSPSGLWPAFVGGEINLAATALAVNTLLTFGQDPEIFDPKVVEPALHALVRVRPLEASNFVRLKFRLADRHVKFDATKYGWPWVPDTVSWVVPTSMALIALQRAQRRGLIRGNELEQRLGLGVEMLFDRACAGGGWNAGNAMVYGVALRPHLDDTALALAALRLYLREPVVQRSLEWLLKNLECRSAFSLSWAVVAAAAYQEALPEVGGFLEEARIRLETLVEHPQDIEDTATVAIAAVALNLDYGGNPFGVQE
jgi:hypothetical protein